MGAPADPDPILDDCARRVHVGDSLVIVHGGGPQIDAELQRRGISRERVDGLRITDATTLSVTESVLCAGVNKALVRAALLRTMQAGGISGQDGGLLQAELELGAQGRSLGFVGRIKHVHCRLLTTLLEQNFVPIVAPLGISSDGSTALNINADTAAGAIAGALRADAYIVVTNVERVRRNVDDPATGIDCMNAMEAERYITDGLFAGGMRPKIQSAIEALGRGAKRALICGMQPRAITRALEDGDATTLVSA